VREHEVFREHRVASHVRETKELGTGDAAGVLHVQNDKVTLENGAINSPLLGLQGHGTVGFDKSLDFTIAVAPLGDWRDRMVQSGMPLVGDVVGGVQQVLNAAQGALVSQFKITGTFGNPQEEVIPVPVVTQPVAFLFGQMARQDKSPDLLGEVKRQGAHDDRGAVRCQRRARIRDALVCGVYPFGDDGTAAGGEDERRLAGHVNTVGFGYPVNPSALSWRAPCS